MLYPFLLNAGAASQSTQPSNPWPTMILIFVIFYFLLIYPQQKKMKKHREMVETLKAGDEIITTGGIYGTIKKIEEGSITLTIAEKVDIKISKNSIGVVLPANAEEAK